MTDTKSNTLMCVACKKRFPLSEFPLSERDGRHYIAGRCWNCDPEGKGGFWYGIPPKEYRKAKAAKGSTTTALCWRCQRRKPLREFRKGVREGVPVRSALCVPCKPSRADMWIPVKESE